MATVVEMAWIKTATMAIVNGGRTKGYFSDLGLSVTLS